MRSTTHLYLRTVFIAVLQLYFFSPSFAQEVSVSPARIFFEGGKDKDYVQRVIVDNSGATRMIFKSSLMDWKRDSTGNKIYYPSGTLPNSNASWVEVLPNVVEIEPHSRQEVTVVLHVPEAAAAEPQVRNSMLFLTQVNAQNNAHNTAGKTSIGVVIKLEFGIHIYYTPALTKRKDLDFLDLRSEGPIVTGNQKFRRIALKIKNTGNVVTDGAVRFELTDKATGKETRIPERPVSLLPGEDQILYLDLPATIKGKYLIVALLDSGTETNLKVGKKELDFN